MKFFSVTKLVVICISPSKWVVVVTGATIAAAVDGLQNFVKITNSPSDKLSGEEKTNLRIHYACYMLTGTLKIFTEEIFHARLIFFHSPLALSKYLHYIIINNNNISFPPTFCWLLFRRAQTQIVLLFFQLIQWI